MMFTFMLDPHFEGMDCIVDHIGKDQATTLVQQYDDLVLLPLLNNTMIFLNPSQATTSLALAPF